MKMNDMGDDLENLFDRLAKGEGVLSQIVNRHAAPWYEGATDFDEKRFTDFMARAESLVWRVAHLRGQELRDAWMDGICEIDEGYDPNAKPYIEQLDYKDLVRHYLNGGSAWGIGKNIKNQIDEMISREQLVLLNTARKRFDDGE